MLQSITINTSVVQKCVFNNGCKGDPRKALLKSRYHAGHNVVISQSTDVDYSSHSVFLLAPDNLLLRVKYAFNLEMLKYVTT